MVRVRFAPSPTGYVHIGGLRTALYNFLFARRNNGTFILRIEDTDTKRAVSGGLENIISTLHAFGLDPDEGPVLQSGRLDLYRKAAESLVERGAAYRCYCTADELEARRKTQEAAHQPTRYDRRCRRLPSGPAAGPHVVRFAAPESGGITAFEDVIHGRIETPHESLDDTVVLKTDGYPTYHLASVVDDHDQKITHVIRGVEWIPSTPKHILLYAAFGWSPPTFAHLPLLLNADKSKLSKRQMDASVEDYLAKGYLPDALLNFVALLGWNPTADREIFTKQELIESFDLKKVNKSDAVVNVQKLDWLNSQYLRLMPEDEYTRRAITALTATGFDVRAVPMITLKSMLSLERDRVKKFTDLPDSVSYFFKLPDYAAELLVWKKSSVVETAKRLSTLSDFFTNYQGSWSSPALETAVKDLIDAQKLGVGDTLWPLRVALSGRDASPGPFEIASVLGKDQTLRRIAVARNKLEND